MRATTWPWSTAQTMSLRTSRTAIQLNETSSRLTVWPTEDCFYLHGP